MMDQDKRVRVLYSFPHKIGTDRISTTAWFQVEGVHKAGAEVLLYTGVLSKPFPPGVIVRETLRRWGVRIPYKAIGRLHALALHDWIVSRRLEALAGQIDIVHTWPLAAVYTLRAAKRLGICSVLERPNAHTRFAYDVVNRECERIGVPLPRGHEHKQNDTVLRKEEREYDLADKLLCPSDFVARTFVEQGFDRSRLLITQYGCDESKFFPAEGAGGKDRPFTMIYVGGAAPRKGLHFALDAWLKSPAKEDGLFLICGAFVPGYAEKLGSMLSHPSVKVLGHRNDVADLMRESDVFVLPTIEEGSALVTYEARASGLVLLVSDSAGALATHMENALIHKAGDVAALTGHIRMLYEDRGLLSRFRENSLAKRGDLSWTAAGRVLLTAYRDALKDKQPRIQA
jgi:glycosyltransferase involved in cell wall biosynthesis